MFKSKSTRRAILTATLAAGIAGAAATAPAQATPFHSLAHRIRALSRAARELDYGDEPAVEAHYAMAEPIVAAVVAAPARTLGDLGVKAEALAWAAGFGPLDLPEDTTSARLVASIIRDLMAAANENAGGTSA